MKPSARYLIITLAIISIAAIAYAIVLQRERNEPGLIIVGGDSAANIIESNIDIDLSQYPDAYFVSIPSASAWILLEEEVITPVKERRFYPLCISGEQASDSCFTTKIDPEDFLEAASVIAFNIGNDPLTVYLKDDPRLTSLIANNNERRITVDELRHIISHSDSLDVQVLAPTFNSGTRNAYRDILGGFLSRVCPTPITLYSEGSEPDILDGHGRPYIILGSNYFYIKALSEGDYDCIDYKVVDRYDHLCVKNCFIYCVAFTTDEPQVLQLPEKCATLLKRMDVHNADLIKDNKIKCPADRGIIVKSTQLLDW